MSWGRAALIVAAIGVVGFVLVMFLRNRTPATQPDPLRDALTNGLARLDGFVSGAFNTAKGIITAPFNVQKTVIQTGGNIAEKGIDAVSDGLSSLGSTAKKTAKKIIPFW